MDINGIRLKQYNKLLREFMRRPEQAMLPNHGMLLRFAVHSGVSARYLSHINNGRKNIGDATARQLEKGNGKPFGWLDADSDAPVKQPKNASTQGGSNDMAISQFLELSAEHQTVAAEVIAALHATTYVTKVRQPT